MISQMSSQKELLLRGMYVMMNDYKKNKNAALKKSQK